MAITVKLGTGDYLTLNDLDVGEEYELPLIKRITLADDEDDVGNITWDFVDVYEGPCGKVYYRTVIVGSVFHQEEILAEWRGNYHQLIYNHSSVGYPKSLPKNHEIFLSNIGKKDFEKRVKWFIDQEPAYVEEFNSQYSEDKAVDKQLQKAKAKTLDSSKLRL